VNAKIEHFGVSYGFQPHLLKKRTFENAWDESNLMANRTYNLIRRVILENLRRYSKRSLKTFTEYDQLLGPFIYDPGMFAEQPLNGPWNLNLDPLEAMQLLVFRCKDLESLISFDGIDDSTVGMRHRLQNRQDDPGKLQHSVWLHVCLSYAFFNHCDCIMIESSDSTNILSPQWWEFPAHWASAMAEASTSSH
jgi:hypothetical protein